MLRALLCIALVAILQGCDRPVQHATEPATAPVVLVVDIEGMHCTACAASISATLKNCTGIQAANVSFEDAKATITADNQGALEQAVQTARDMGYTVEPSASDES